jgi:peptidyl-tRNA hydrolase, PTH1 family
VRFFHRDLESTSLDGMWVVVGLGNPGARYENTRHNIGFMVVSRLAQRAGVTLTRSKHRARTSRTEIAGVPALLALPETFMNESGFAVAHLSRFYKVPPERTLIVCDDIDLPFATLRLRPSGSSGGQRGLESIMRELGTSNFPRLRLGVGRPEYDAARHVLEPFPPNQARLLPELIGIACDAIEEILKTGDVPAVMNRFNRNWEESLAGV